VSALQILGLAGAFTALSIALGLVAVSGTLAIPALAAVAGVGAIALGLKGGGGKKEGEISEMELIKGEIIKSNKKLDTLIEGLVVHGIPALILSNKEGGKHAGEAMARRLGLNA